ncbi:hypothetical protein [Glycomyces buryatensis]|uniref:Uncharacterized protein n=1 Tax=Glycomyces buryatensis TaxID=2570927 RepID=A0A4S8Q6W6_9ACTN|nr:hypothetical protein [Glycomyces buryatensis]THV38442.1 hypothetical protein FAB82_18500 [Glycomyces buryatensis]
MSATKTLQLPTRRYWLGPALTWEALKYYRYWFVAAIVLSALLPFLVSFSRDIDTSTWSYTANIGAIFTAIVAGGFLYSLAPSFIANSLTRRELVVSFGLFGLTWGLFCGALVFAGLVAEHAYYGAMGWTQSIEYSGELTVMASFGQAAEHGALYLLAYPLYFLGGAIIGAATYRWEGTGWLIAFPVAVVVIGLTDALSRTVPTGPDWLRFVTEYAQGWGRGAVLAAFAAALVIGAAIGYRLLIDIPVRAKKA